MSTIFREIFCGHFPWKLKDENLQKHLPKFRRIFRRSLAKISQELRSGDCGHKKRRPCPKIYVRKTWLQKISILSLVRETAHLQPEFTAGLGLFGASFVIFLQISCLRGRFCLFKCRFCPKGESDKKTETFRGPLRAIPWNMLNHFRMINELQTHPNLHSPVWVGRNDTDQTHPHITL